MWAWLALVILVIAVFGYALGPFGVLFAAASCIGLLLVYIGSGYFTRFLQVAVAVATATAVSAVFLAYTLGLIGDERIKAVPPAVKTTATTSIDRSPYPKVSRAPSLRLDGLDLASVDLSGLSAPGASAVGTTLDRARLSAANLSGANLRDVRLHDADLRGANLTGADLTNADLTGACLIGATLTGAILDNADATGAAVTDAVVSVETASRAKYWPAQGSPEGASCS